MSEAKKMTLMAACRDFFGLKTNEEGKTQTAMEFGKEYKALTEQDKLEIRAGLEQNGYEIMEAPKAAAA